MIGKKILEAIERRVEKTLGTKPTDSKASRREYWASKLDSMTDAEVADIPRDELPRVDGIMQRRVKGMIDQRLQPSDAEEKQQREKERSQTVVSAARKDDSTQVDLSAGRPANVPHTSDYKSEVFNGWTLNELLVMRDYKRDQVPKQYTVKAWKKAVRDEMQRWAAEATKPAEARQASDQSENSPLTPEDRELLIASPMEFIDDDKRTRRYGEVQAGVHPDTGAPFDVDAETARAKQERAEKTQQVIAGATEETAQGGRSLSQDDIDAEPDSEPPNRRRTALDTLQLAGDAVGIIDPTGIVDGANAAVSVVRSIREPDRRGEHLRNAAISAVSMIPYVGDLAKVGKAKSAAKTVKDGSRLAELAKGARGASAFSELFGGAFGGGNGGGPGGPDVAGGSDDDEERRRRSTEAIEDETEAREHAANGWEKFTDKLIDWSFGLAKAITSVVGILEASRLTNKGVLYANRHLSDLNPELANAEAQREIAELNRNMREADQLADPLSEASQADILADDTRSKILTPLKGIFTDLTATGSKLQWSLVASVDRMTRFSDGLEAIQGKIDSLTDSIEGWLGIGGDEELKDDRGNDTAWARFLDDISDGTFDDETGRDRFFEEWNGDGRRDERRRERRNRGA